MESNNQTAKVRVKNVAIPIISFLMAVFGTWGLSIGYITSSGPLINSASVFSLLWFIIFAVMFWAALISISFRDVVICGVFGGIFAAFTCVGAAFTALGTVPLHEPYLYINIIATAFVMAAILRILFVIGPYVKNWLYKSDKCKILSGRLEKPGKGMFFIFFGLILVLWIPAFLALFPGFLSYDGPAQLAQVFIYKQIDAHQPVVHTYFLALCFKLGSALFGSYEAGLVIHSIVQALVVAGAFAYMGIFLCRHRIPKLLIIISLLFVAINPIIQVFVFTTTKDVLFSAFLLLLIMFTIDYISQPDKVAGSPWLMVRYAVTVILMALMRKQGIYIFIIAVPFLIWIGRKHFIKLGATFIASILAVMIFYGPISNALGIIPGTSREMLSVPMQQIVRVINTAPESVTEEQKEVIRRYIPEEVWDDYIPEISDPVKHLFNSGEFEKDPVSFIKIWLEIGLEHPNIYVDAFAYLTDAYWYPSVETNHYWSRLDFFHDILDEIPVKQHSLFPAYYDYLMKVGQDSLGNIPILSATVSNYMPVWATLLCIAVIFRQRKFSLLIPLAIIATLIGSLFLGPVACIRYTLPLLMLCPLLMALPFIKGKRYKIHGKALEIFRFAATGVICFALDWGTMMLMMKLTSLPDWICIAAGFILSVILNYIICVVWVFEDAGKQNVASQVVFLGSSIIGLGLTELFMLIFMQFMPASIAKIIVTLIVMVWNYVAKRFALYRIRPYFDKKKG